METKEEKIKKLKQDCFTIQESLYSLSAILRTLTNEVIFTDIEADKFDSLLDVEHEIFVCRKKMKIASLGVDKINDIFE